MNNLKPLPKKIFCPSGFIDYSTQNKEELIWFITQCIPENKRSVTSSQLILQYQYHHRINKGQEKYNRKVINISQEFGCRNPQQVAEHSNLCIVCVYIHTYIYAHIYVTYYYNVCIYIYIYTHTYIYIEVILVPALEVVQPQSCSKLFNLKIVQKMNQYICQIKKKKKDKLIQQTIEEPL